MYIHHHRGIIPPPIPWGGWEHGTRDHIYTYLYSTWITARKEYRNSDHGPMLHEFQANYGYPHGPSQRTSLWDWIPEFDRHGRVISLGHQGCGGCWSLERGVWTRGPSLLLIDGLLTVIEIMIDSGHSRVLLGLVRLLNILSLLNPYQHMITNVYNVFYTLIHLFVLYLYVQLSIVSCAKSSY